jgi:hypothetical protein
MANEMIVRTMDDAERAAKAMSASGFFQDAKSAAQAVVKILAGQELGFGPFASMTGVNIIQNKPVLAANLMAAAVKRQGKYNYRVTRLDDTGCELTFLEGGQEVGKSKFDRADAEKAQLLSKDNWKKYPRNMYFARALSNGQKWYAPDVFNGATVYTPDELGAVVDEEGNAVVEVVEIAPEEGPIASEMMDKPYGRASVIDPAHTKENEIGRPLVPVTLRSLLAKKASTHTGDASPEQVGLMVGMMDMVFAPDKDAEKIRRSCLVYLFGVDSSKKLSGPQIKAVLDWLKPVKDSGGAYSPDPMAARELHAVWEAEQLAKGQTVLPGLNKPA